MCETPFHFDTYNMAAAVANSTSMAAQVDLSTIPVSPEGAASAPSASEATSEVTVFHDKENFNVKHPLMNEWTLWFTKPPSGKVGRRIRRYR